MVYIEQLALNVKHPALFWVLSVSTTLAICRRKTWSVTSTLGMLHNERRRIYIYQMLSLMYLSNDCLVYIHCCFNLTMLASAVAVQELHERSILN